MFVNKLKMNSVAEAVMQVTEKELSAKQKEIAKIEHPKDKIDGGDLASLRSGKKPVKEDTVDEAEKVSTPTGMRVFGSSYGNSQKARADQTKSPVDKLKGPKDKELIGKDMKDDKKTRGQYDEALVGNQHKIDKNKNNKIDAHDFKLLRKEEEDCVSEPEVKDIAKKEVKGHVKKLHQKESFNLASKLKNHMQFVEELEEELNEVLSKDATAGDYIHDFIHSDNPKFEGKSKAERKKMALGAYYAKNEEATTDCLTGKEKPGKSNAFTSFKLRLKGDPDMKAPAGETPVDSEAQISHKANGGPIEVPAAKINAKEVKLGEESLDELSKGTLASYATKASSSGDKRSNSNLSSRAADKMNNYTDVNDMGDKEDHKSVLRSKGIAGAVKRLAKEETLDEAGLPDIADKKEKMAIASNTGKGKPLHNVAKGFKAFIQGKKEPMESVESEGDTLEEGKGLSPGQDDAPFDKPYTTTPKNVKDKSGAVHTPMSRAKDLARTAMKRLKTEMLGKAPGNNG